MKQYQQERQAIAQAAAQLIADQFHFLHRGAFQLPDRGICIFGNDCHATDVRSQRESEAMEMEAHDQCGGDREENDVYTAVSREGSLIDGCTWVVVTYDTADTAEEWSNLVWQTWFGICEEVAAANQELQKETEEVENECE